MSSIATGGSAVYAGVFRGVSGSCNGIAILAGTSTGGGSLYILDGYSQNGTRKVAIYDNGNIQNANNSYGALSDERYKENIVDAKDYTEKLCSLSVKNFNLVGDNTKQLGLIAQEVEEIIPGIVEKRDTRKYDDDGNLESGFEDERSIKYSILVPMLITSLQSMKRQVDKIDDMEKDIATAYKLLDAKRPSFFNGELDKVLDV